MVEPMVKKDINSTNSTPSIDRVAVEYVTPRDSVSPEMRAMLMDMRRGALQFTAAIERFLEACEKREENEQG